MNATQIHLALTHVPVMLSIIGLVILILSFFRKNDTLAKTALSILLAAGLLTIPVFFTGEGAEEVVEKLPGVSEAIIEKHEDFAKITLALVSVSGLLALIGLVAYAFGRFVTMVKVLALILSVVSAGAMAQTAHLGGQIRHSEIRSAALIQEAGNAGAESNKATQEAAGKAGTETEEDD